MIKISPSLLAADFSRLGEEIKRVEPYTELLHIDIMDGVFVPNITLGFPIIESIRKITSMVFDVHLMIASPELYIKRISDAGADIITFHIECENNVDRLIDLIKSTGCKVGISIKPTTPIDTVFPYLDRVDKVLIMTVEPGFGGQTYNPICDGKITELRRRIDSLYLPVLIQADGGITAENIREKSVLGLDIAVAGTAVFGSADPATAIRRLSGEEE